MQGRSDAQSTVNQNGNSQTAGQETPPDKTEIQRSVDKVIRPVKQLLREQQRRLDEIEPRLKGRIDEIEPRLKERIDEKAALLADAEERVNKSVAGWAEHLANCDKFVNEAIGREIQSGRAFFLLLFGVQFSASVIVTAIVAWTAIWGYKERFESMEKSNSKSLDNIGQREKEFRRLVSDYERKEGDLKKTLDSTNKRYNELARANGQGHVVMMLLADARNHLTVANDPQKCVETTQQALEVLNRNAADFAENADALSSFAAMRPAVLLQLCEGVLYQRDFARLERLASDAVALNCNCPDATYFLGRAKLQLAIERKDDDPARKTLLEEAQRLLSNTSSNYGMHSTKQLTLCAVYLELSQFGAAEKIAGEFLKTYSNDATSLRRLKDAERGFVTLADAFELLGLYERGKVQVGKLVPYDCKSTEGKLNAIDAELFEQVAIRLIARRESIVKGRNSHEELGVFLGSVVYFLRKSCNSHEDSSGCPSCVSSDEDLKRPQVVPIDLIRRFALPPYKLAPFSRDKSLGMEVDGKRAFIVQRFELKKVPHLQQASVLEGDIFPVIYKETVLTDLDEDPPEDRYMEWPPPAPSPATPMPPRPPADPSPSE